MNNLINLESQAPPKPYAIQKPQELEDWRLLTEEEQMVLRREAIETLEEMRRYRAELRAKGTIVHEYTHDSMMLNPKGNDSKDCKVGALDTSNETPKPNVRNVSNINN